MELPKKGLIKIARYYFYCPKCGLEQVVEDIPPTGTVANTRGGYGTPIYHYECPQCHNLDAGYMRFGLCKMKDLPDEEQKKYFKRVIDMYQNIRGVGLDAVAKTAKGRKD